MGPVSLCSELSKGCLWLRVRVKSLLRLSGLTWSGPPLCPCLCLLLTHYTQPLCPLCYSLNLSTHLGLRVLPLWGTLPPDIYLCSLLSHSDLWPNITLSGRPSLTTISKIDPILLSPCSSEYPPPPGIYLYSLSISPPLILLLWATCHPCEHLLNIYWQQQK